MIEYQVFARHGAMILTTSTTYQRLPPGESKQNNKLDDVAHCDERSATPPSNQY
jgi:hypothetical protein